MPTLRTAVLVAAAMGAAFAMRIHWQSSSRSRRRKSSRTRGRRRACTYGGSKRTFNPGDKITLTFGPLRNGDAGGIFMEATLADGKVMTYSTELPTE